MRREVAKVLQDNRFLEAFASGGNVEIMQNNGVWMGKDNPNFEAHTKYRVSLPDKVDPIDYETACNTIVAKESTLMFVDGASDYKVMGIKKSHDDAYTLLVKSVVKRIDCEIYSHSLDKYNCKDFPLLIRTPQYIEVDLTNV